MTQITGTCDPAFAGLADAMARSLDAGLDIGCGVAVVLDGRMVANLWGGHTDAARSRPWAEDTLTNVWSCTKAVMATAMALCVQRGLLGYDDPIARHWPAFGVNGKDSITIGMVLTHTAGLNGFNTPVADDIYLDWDATVQALAAMAPNFVPGSRMVYHALTQGHLLGEVIRRVTGLMPGDFVARNLAAPLGMDFHIGLAADQDHRVAELVAGPGLLGGPAVAMPFPQALSNPAMSPLAPNRRAYRAVQFPAGNGQGTATALALMCGELVASQPRVLTPQFAGLARTERFRGPEQVNGAEVVWAAGYRLEDAVSYGPRASRGTIGHGGWGGALCFADPDRRLGFAYVPNHLCAFAEDIDPRRQMYVQAVYDAL